MGKVKTKLMEETMDDMSPNLGGVEYLSEITEPNAQDWAISELFNAVSTLEKKPENAATYVNDLKSIQRRLEHIIKRSQRVF